MAQSDKHCYGGTTPAASLEKKICQETLFPRHIIIICICIFFPSSLFFSYSCFSYSFPFRSESFCRMLVLKLFLLAANLPNFVAAMEPTSAEIYKWIFEDLQRHLDGWRKMYCEICLAHCPDFGNPHSQTVAQTYGEDGANLWERVWLDLVSWISLTMKICFLPSVSHG
jgi:hypothetical protein